MPVACVDKAERVLGYRAEADFRDAMPAAVRDVMGVQGV